MWEAFHYSSFPSTLDNRQKAFSLIWVPGGCIWENLTSFMWSQISCNINKAYARWWSSFYVPYHTIWKNCSQSFTKHCSLVWVSILMCDWIQTILVQWQLKYMWFAFSTVAWDHGHVKFHSFYKNETTLQWPKLSPNTSIEHYNITEFLQ